MSDFSHLNKNNEVIMVDVSGKSQTLREAQVQGVVSVQKKHSKYFSKEIIDKIISTAKIAGVLGTKQTSYLIPHCHNIPLMHIAVDIHFKKLQFIIIVTTKAFAQTGVEMEAFVGCSIAALTIYDMIKAVVPTATIGPFKLVQKSGGKTDLKFKFNI